MITSTGSLKSATCPPACPPLAGASPPAALDGSSDILVYLFLAINLELNTLS
jgi:hypothetical protein